MTAASTEAVEGGAPARARPKRWPRVLVAAGLVLVLIGGLELALRAAGVGADDHAVFAPLPDQEDYQMLNAAYLERYFRYRLQPTPAFTPFRAEKEPGSFRVFVLGGSTVGGFPYRYYLGFPARLQHRLEAFAAGQRIEVVNLGFFAANSYALWDMKEALVAQSPDAVVIYAGHNEYYGALGAGSALTTPGPHFWKRIVLRLRRWVLYRALERLFSGETEAVGAGASRMLKSARDITITMDGATYRAGVAQFEANMRGVLHVFQQAGIPVYAGTLISNLKDQPPRNPTEGALADYEWGQDLLAQGDTTGARVAFVAAKEKDEARLRAPEAMNEVLRSFDAEGLLTLVNLQPLAVARGPHGIEDEWFFLDHLHPDYEGYDAIAEAFFDVLKTHPALAPSGLQRASETYITPGAFERSHGAVQISQMHGALAVSQEEEAVAMVGMLGLYRTSRHYLDSLTVETFIHGLSGEEALQVGIRRARSQADTLRAMLLYRSLLHVRPFDTEGIAEAVSFAEAATDTTLLPLSEEIVFRALNLTGDAAYLDRLAALRLRQGLPEDAARLKAMAEEKQSAAPVQ